MLNSVEIILLSTHYTKSKLTLEKQRLLQNILFLKIKFAEVTKNRYLVEYFSHIWSLF